jgi:DNA-binding transcriptional LysR family regulator
MLDVRRLQVLVAAVREGSLAAAARTLDLTPSAASQAVSALETSVGRPLLIRHGRGVRATAEGERLALRGQGILADLAAAEDEMAGGTNLQLHVAAPPTVVAGLIPGVLARLADSHPGLRLGVLEMEGSRAREAARSNEVDIAIVDHHAHADPDRGEPLVPVVLLDEPVLVWLPSGHPAALSERVELGMLRDCEWIASPPLSSCWDLLARACASAGFAPRVVATVAEYRSAAALVSAGLGLSIVPRLAIGAACGMDLAARPSTPPVTRRLTALIRPGPRPVRIRALLSALQAEAYRAGFGS